MNLPDRIAMEIRTHQIDVGHCRLAATTHRQPGAAREWVTFSNSLFTDQRLWQQQVRALSPRFDILTYDQRGHGASESAGPYDFDRLARDVLALWDALGIARSHGVGLSMGSATLAHVGAMAPERLPRLVFADGGPARAPGQERMWTERAELVRAQGLPVMFQQTLDRWFPQGSPQAREIALAMMQATSPEGYVGCALALAAVDTQPALDVLRCPILFIAGELDGALPAALRAQAARGPGRRYLELPAAGHLSNLDAGPAFSQAVDGFL